jgi:translation initiation factor eIF-2B subunit gamma
VYVCKRSVLNTLLEKPVLDSFREEFLPWLCKAQYQRAKREKYSQGMCSSDDLITDQVFVTQVLNPVTNIESQSIFQAKNIEPSVSASPEDSDDDGAPLTSLRVGLVLHRAGNGFAARANTIHSFFELNQQVCLSNQTNPLNQIHVQLVSGRRDVFTAH